MGILVLRALLLRVYIKAPDYWNLPHTLPAHTKTHRWGTYVCTCVCLYACMYSWMGTFVLVWEHVCTYLRMHVSFMRACTHARMPACMYLHTHVWNMPVRISCSKWLLWYCVLCQKKKFLGVWHLQGVFQADRSCPKTDSGCDSKAVGPLAISIFTWTADSGKVTGLWKARTASVIPSDAKILHGYPEIGKCSCEHLRTRRSF